MSILSRAFHRLDSILDDNTYQIRINSTIRFQRLVDSSNSFSLAQACPVSENTKVAPAVKLERDSGYPGPKSILEQILDDADLDVLGREDFWPRNVALRRELAFFGKEFTDLEWFSGQFKFVSTHTYFTAAARALRDTRQTRSVALLQSTLDQLGPGK